MDRKEEKQEIARVVAELDVHLREPFVAYFESQQRLQRALTAPPLILSARSRVQFLREQQAAAAQFADDVERMLGALASTPAASQQ